MWSSKGSLNDFHGVKKPEYRHQESVGDLVEKIEHS